ncbi:MAG: 23S rRNA (uracil(1939)-C(5))-methyltransferase RlmD [Clostridia bacterium]|nr:23S rRNA (uracil(1939)-C(5))-methyltransferase RlmD [Clostridia bacterium]
MSEYFKNDLLELSIEGLSNLGAGIAHAEDGCVVFVQNAVPGDTVKAKIIKTNKSYLVARVETILQPSPDRVENDCSSKGCGGCIYRSLSYEAELTEKRAYVAGAFQKAGLSVEVETVRTTGVTEGYRNKAQYPVQAGKHGLEAGFFAAYTHRVVPCDDCRLQPKVFGEIVAFTTIFCNQNGISAYDEVSGKGLLRHIFLRMGKATGEILVCLVLNGKKLPKEAAFAKELVERFPAVKSVQISVNEQNTNVVLGDTFRVIAGRDYIEDILCGLRFRISAGSFYQVNHDACELLYGIAKEKADLHGGETILDLYCGIGTIGLSMAKDARRVVGIEIVLEAIDCAKENAKANGIANAHFFCGDAGKAEALLQNAERELGDLSGATVILDPPRKGCAEKLLHYLAKRDFQRIVYVSCNPDTLARDCRILSDLGYQIGKVTPVDLFPRTGHVESVVLLSRNDLKDSQEG